MGSSAPMAQVRSGLRRWKQLSENRLKPWVRMCDFDNLSYDCGVHWCSFIVFEYQRFQRFGCCLNGVPKIYIAIFGDKGMLSGAQH
jgi:hypothetical protein